MLVFNENLERLAVYLPCTCIPQIYRFCRLWRVGKSTIYVLSIGFTSPNPARASNFIHHAAFGRANKEFNLHEPKPSGF